MLILSLFWIMTIAACGYASVLGGWEGRWTTAIIMIASALTLLSDQVLGLPWHETNIVIFAVDVFAFAGMYVVAARSRRWWPVWIAAFQLNSVAAHLATVISPSFSALVYHGYEGLWALPGQLVMVFGIFRDRLWKYRYEFA